VLVAHREHRLLERASLHFGEEGGKFLLGSQIEASRIRAPAAIPRRIPAAAGARPDSDGNYTGRGQFVAGRPPR
jgi:hypothetical protein